MVSTVVTRAFVFVAGVVFLMIPTIAGAHAGNNDPNMVHACIGNISLAVRIVGVSGACFNSPASKVETPAHWAVQGPTGVPGTNGTNGTNGSDGASVTLVDYFSGNQNGCPNGGAILAAGNPSVNVHVCNGLDATVGTKPDGPCFDNTNRYVDCGNGTVTDTATGLIWLKWTNCLPDATYAAANGSAAALKDGDCLLTDRSSPSDWRLPTKDEWQATLAFSQTYAEILDCGNQNPPSPYLTNDPGTDCLLAGPSSFVGIPVPAWNGYWSSSTAALAPFDIAPISASFASLSTPGVFSGADRLAVLRVWPVRGGTR